MKLRIISGILKNRHFDAPSGHKTHPMSERARGAIFNILGDISGLDVLDAYGGSGALGLEAYSRGAKQITIVDVDITAYETIQQTIEQFGIESRVSVVRANVSSWTNRNKDKQYDVVFIDPPYDTVNYAILIRLAETVRKDGVIVYSLPNNHDFSLPHKQFEKLSEKKYAGASLVFYRRIR